MTRADDVREAIAEQSAGPAERRSMNTLAGAVEESLSRDVPYRPEFRAELRRRLMAEARRKAAPWYRRPAVWGSTVAAAAAVTILAFGLQMWQGNQTQNPPVQPGNSIAKTSEPPVQVPGNGQSVDKHYVAYSPLPPVDLKPEMLPEGHPGPESLAGVDVVQGLKVFNLEVKVDEALFNRIAQGLSLTGQVRPAAGGFTVTQGARTLELAGDGRVSYTDTSTDAGTAPIDAGGAQLAARSFLDRAALPVPSLEPTTLEGIVGGKRVYAVTYTPRVDGRPVVNGRTVIQVNGQGQIVQAVAYVQGAQTVKGSYQVITADAARSGAKAADSATSYDGVDLVYVRTADTGAHYLQPYWRVYGTDGRGARLVRYVPALVPGP